MDETDNNKSDTTVILAVLIIVLIIAGVLYLFYRVPNWYDTSKLNKDVDIFEQSRHCKTFIYTRIYKCTYAVSKSDPV